MCLKKFLDFFFVFLELSEEEVKRLKKKITEMEDEHSSEVNR